MNECAVHDGITSRHTIPHLSRQFIYVVITHTAIKKKSWCFTVHTRWNFFVTTSRRLPTALYSGYPHSVKDGFVFCLHCGGRERGRKGESNLQDTVMLGSGRAGV
jgi:hypothetical protein